MAKQLRIDGGEDERANSEPISVYLPADLYAWAKHRAKLDDRTLSGFVRWCVAQQMRGGS